MFSKIKCVVVLGAGGKATYYVSKMLLLSGAKVECYDMNENDHTRELKSLGAKVVKGNPKSFEFDKADLIIHTRALPSEIISKIAKLNPKNKIYESGKYYDLIVKAYEKGKFKNTPSALKAIKESEIAPLFDLDFSECLLIGVTGSKGKTTTAYMIYETLYNLGAKVSAVTTIGARVEGKSIETGLHTSTPSAQELARLFKAMLKNKSKIIVLEASSHAIATGRIAGLKFDIAILTNLQPEHLDFHKTLDDVIKTKKQLVTTFLKPNGTIIVNNDDVNIREKVIDELPTYTKEIFTITTSKKGTKKTNPFIISSIIEKKHHVLFDANCKKLELVDGDYLVPYPGSFNAYNIAPAIIIAGILKYKHSNIKKAIKKLGVVSGRNEVIQEKPFKVVLDFAHTPESLEAILSTYRNQHKDKKIIVVFGAAGQRDHSKRPRMGEAAAKYADITILTSEDPRTEDLTAINSEIKSGWGRYVQQNNLGEKREIILFNDIKIREKNRTNAIEKAISLASPGDVVVCAGKGPEQSMCIGFEEIPWDEKQTILGLLNK
jgi:UDP-N-acetylmuramoyl-L-alanyl-D-glutamate--2,6-diaminopimelate ligase